MSLLQDHWLHCLAKSLTFICYPQNYNETIQYRRKEKQQRQLPPTSEHHLYHHFNIYFSTSLWVECLSNF